MNKIFKKLAAFLIVIVLLTMTFAAYAEEDERPELEKPAGFTVRANEFGDLILRLTHSDRIMELMENEVYILCEFDWKINDGPWNFDSKWDGFNEQGLFEYYETNYEWFPVVVILNNFIHDVENSVDIPVFPHSLKLEEFDLKNNTYHFRYRYLYEYSAFDPETETWGYRIETFPYSDVASIGKGSALDIPDSLAAPENLKGELKQYENGQPYFYFTYDIPKSVEDINKQTAVWNELDWKIGNGKWASESGELLFQKGYRTLENYLVADPIDEGGWGETDIKENTYHFRMRFLLQKPDGSFVYSPFSNEVSIGITAFYEKASSWAEEELNKAYANDLIPDILMGADMTKPITREEFAELAVRLCEKTIEGNIAPESPNPFTDTTNPQILKAYKLGITTGTSKTTFSPSMLIDREQCATMLYRAIKAIAPNADYSIDGVKDFPDQKDISSWAVEGTKYMFKLGIIKGDNNGNFMPKATTPAQEAVQYGMATREAAVLMTVRTFDKIPEIKISTPSAAVTPTPGVPSSTVTPTPVPPATATPVPTPAEPASSEPVPLEELITKGNRINSLYYEWTNYADGEKYNEGKAWMKGNMAKKQEPLSTGSTVVYTYNMATGEYFAYTVGENVAYSGKYDPNNPELLKRPTEIVSWYFPEGLEPIGTEVINGQVCTVFVAKEQDSEVGKAWVSNETGLKLREEYGGWFGSPKITCEYNYIVIDGHIDDSVFDLPSGMTLQ